MKSNFFAKWKSFFFFPPDFSIPVCKRGGFLFLNNTMFLPDDSEEPSQTSMSVKHCKNHNLECEMMDQPGKQALQLLLLSQAINHVRCRRGTCCGGHCSMISPLLYGAGHAGKFSYAAVARICMTGG